MASNETRRFFPVFVDSRRRRVVVIGGGEAAERRVMIMDRFQFPIDVISETLTEGLEGLANGGQISWLKDRFRFSHLDGADLVLVCAEDRETNHSIGVYCRGRGILVNVCDSLEESTFWFPELAMNDELTAGLIDDGSGQGAVEEAAAYMRNAIEKKEYKK